jgi:branched-chain amino acid aminotransferase
LLIFTRPLVAWPATQKLVLETSGIFAGGHYAGTKMLSWVPHAAVLEKAHREGFDDALLMNEKGQLAECTSANIFLVRAGKIFTPPLSSGCLPGITREVLLEIALPAGIELCEQELRAEDLAAAEEVFISSTTREVAPIAEIRPAWKYPAPGPVTRRAEEIFKQYVGAWLAGAGRS